MTEVEDRNDQRERATSSNLLFWLFQLISPRLVPTYQTTPIGPRISAHGNKYSEQGIRRHAPSSTLSIEIILVRGSEYSISRTPPRLSSRAMIRRGGASGRNSVRDGVALSHSGSDDKPSERAIIAPYVVPIRPLCSGFHFITSHWFFTC